MPRHWPGSSDSPLTTARGGSSLSNMEELEYDEYDGAMMPGEHYIYSYKVTLQFAPRVF